MNNAGKQKYLDTLMVGTLIAFKTNKTNKENKCSSGKVIEVNGNDILAETLYGLKYQLKKEDILWVKTGSRWPKGIYQMLRGEKENENVEEKQNEVL